MHIVRYTPDKAQEWDTLVEGSRNGTFLFRRSYMDYHHDRFVDHSLLFYKTADGNDTGHGRLMAVLPANEVVATDGTRQKTLCSHQGLTYGGFVLTAETRSADVGELFALTISYLRDNGFTEWVYKPVPTIYHRLPAEEDEYWLWRNGAVLSACRLSATVALNGQMAAPLERRRRRGISKASALGYHIVEDASLDTFWPIMTDNLRQRYHATPVHTLAEMTMLRERLPQNIEVYLCCDGKGEAQAGAVIYLANSETVHVQYAHATPQGKADGAIDILYSCLMDRYRRQGYRFFDIGTSNEDDGRILNANLIAQKEGFGGRGVAYKTYSIKL